ncbi:MAG: carbon-nitrogen hydrolase family protein [Oceanococcus sp.]
MSIVSVAALQYCAGDDCATNFATLSALADQAVDAGVQLILLPENALFMGRQERHKLAMAEPVGDGPWQNQLAALAQRLGIALVCGSFPLQVADLPEKVWPASLVFDADGELLARYDKLHLFDVGLADGSQYRESRYFQAGENSPQCFDFAGLRFGLSICYDLRFPELYRQLSSDGAQVLLVPAAFTYATGEQHWEVLLRARAIENLSAVVAANQCGEHPSGHRSWGHSMIVDSWGQVLSQCEHAPGFALARIDSDELAGRRQQFPALAHRRI